MKISIGNIVEGENYFKRSKVDKTFLKKLEQSRNVNISSPRRIGKSSFMKHMISSYTEKKGIYLTVESINSSNEFFKKIYKVLLQELKSSNKLKEYIDDTFKRLKITSIGLDGISFDATELDYFEELVLLGKKMSNLKEQFILYTDEFSQTLENIIRDYGEDKGKDFLHKCRELRINHELKNHVQFVYAGSIGLEHIVYKLNESKAINDLGQFNIPTLSEEEAYQLISFIIDDSNIEFSEENKKYLLDKMKWHLPYFYQLIMSDIENQLDMEETNVISINHIDISFNNVLLTRTYFEHWHSRLRTLLKGEEYNFAKKVLNSTSKKSRIHISEIHDLGQIDDIDINYILNILIHDAYLMKDFNNSELYHFCSPLLSIWWNENIYV